MAFNKLNQLIGRQSSQEDDLEEAIAKAKESQNQPPEQEDFTEQSLIDKLQNTETFQNFKNYLQRIDEAIPSTDEMEQYALPSSPNAPREEMGLPPIIKGAAVPAGIVASAIPDTSFEIKQPEFKDPRTGEIIPSKLPPMRIDPLAMGSMKVVGKGAKALRGVGNILEEAAAAKRLQSMKPIVKEAELAKEISKAPKVSQELVKSAPIVETGKEIQPISKATDVQQKINRIIEEKKAAKLARDKELEQLSGPNRMSQAQAEQEFETISKKAIDEGKDPFTDLEVNSAFNRLRRIIEQKK